MVECDLIPPPEGGPPGGTPYDRRVDGVLERAYSSARLRLIGECCQPASRRSAKMLPITEIASPRATWLPATVANNAPARITGVKKKKKSSTRLVGIEVNLVKW